MDQWTKKVSRLTYSGALWVLAGLASVSSSGCGQGDGLLSLPECTQSVTLTQQLQVINASPERVAVACIAAESLDAANTTSSSSACIRQGVAATYVRIAKVIVAQAQREPQGSACALGDTYEACRADEAAARLAADRQEVDEAITLGQAATLQRCGAAPAAVEVLERGASMLCSNEAVYTPSALAEAGYYRDPSGDTSDMYVMHSDALGAARVAASAALPVEQGVSHLQVATGVAQGVEVVITHGRFYSQPGVDALGARCFNAPQDTSRDVLTTESHSELPGPGSVTVPGA